MKKSLLAAALLGAFSSMAFAGSSVQLYGQIDAGVTHFTNSPGSVTSLSSGVQGASLIGVKGSEDLGGGLSVLFDAESGFCAAGQSGANSPACEGGGFMQRQAFVGLQNDAWGTLLMGRQYSVAYLNEKSVDPFDFGTTGSYQTTSLLEKGLNGLTDLRRMDQTLTYMTPDVSGFSGVGQYSFNVGQGALQATPVTHQAHAYTLSAAYATGPLRAGVDLMHVDNIQNFGGALNGSSKLDEVFGSYDFGVAKLSGLYSRLSNTGVAGHDSTLMVGATAPMGPGTVMASYTNVKFAGTANAKSNKYSLGYTYALSKQTDVYASISHISNENGANLASGDATDFNTGVANQSSNGYAVGLRHSF